MSLSLRTAGTIEIPDAAGREFDHAAFDPATRRIFVAHTGRDRIEVIDHDAGKHIATLPGFPQAAGVVADDGASISTITAAGAHTTALAAPDWLYVFSPSHRGALTLVDA